MLYFRRVIKARVKRSPSEGNKGQKKEKKVEGKRAMATLDLLKLAEENLGLPIIAEVDSDVVADDCCMSWFDEVTGSLDSISPEPET